MSSERLSFAKRPLLIRSAEAIFTAYEMLEEYDEEGIREFLEGDITVAAVSVVSGIDEPALVDEVVKQASKLQHQAELA
ncbi:hypothetical protein [Pseudoalteromonas galatheae]|uniref:hypothetical protein n=1 Tax=Pseudoalteromonas galatheae TaxID=579562 RepID=UPI0030CB8BF0